MGLKSRIKKKLKIFKPDNLSSPKAVIKQAALIGPKLTIQETKASLGLVNSPAGQLAVTGVATYYGGPAGGMTAAAIFGARNQIAANKQAVQQGGDAMSVNYLGGLQGVLGGLSTSGGQIGAIANIGSSFLQGFLPASGPKNISQSQFFPQAQPIQVMSAAPLIRGAATAVAGFAAPLLAKMSASIGKNVTLRAAMIIIRRLGKFLQSPSAIGAAIGLSVSELSQLITAASLAGSHGRRMNVGNVKALRRAHRRIKSFHKLCGDNDTLRAPRRRKAPMKIINCK